MTTQNNPMSGQISICLDKVTSQHVNVIFSSVSPLKWWKEHTNSYPTLAKLAIKILCVCAVSCASRFH